MKEKESLVCHSSVRGSFALLQETVSHFLLILAPPVDKSQLKDRKIKFVAEIYVRLVTEQRMVI